MKFKLLLINTLLLLATISNAQTNFKNGYVVKSDNDTLFGKIDYRGSLLMGKICRFKTDKNAEESIFTPSDINEYRFNDSKYFVSKTINEKKVFLEFLIKGQINVYYLKDELGEHYYLEKDDQAITEIPYKNEIVYKNEKSYLHHSTKHIGILKYYMQDAPSLLSKIEKTGEPEHSNMINLAKDYHNTVCKDHACIIYEEPVPLFRFAIEPIIGIAKYKFINNSISNIGGNVYVWVPQTSENIFLKTGFTYQRLDEQEDNFEILKFPIQIQYMYHAHKFQPKVSFGYNFMQINYANNYELNHLTCLNAGFNYEFTKKVSLSTTLNSEYTTLSKVFLSRETSMTLMSYTLDLGLYIKL